MKNDTSINNVFLSSDNGSCKAAQQIVFSKSWRQEPSLLVCLCIPCKNVFPEQVKIKTCNRKRIWKSPGTHRLSRAEFLKATFQEGKHEWSQKRVEFKGGKSVGSNAVTWVRPAGASPAWMFAECLFSSHAAQEPLCARVTSVFCFPPTTSAPDSLGPGSEALLLTLVPRLDGLSGHVRALCHLWSPQSSVKIPCFSKNSVCTLLSYFHHALRWFIDLCLE